jgi:hypothetical protein
MQKSEIGRWLYPCSQGNFTETEDGIEIELIEIDSTHYGNKK